MRNRSELVKDIIDRSSKVLKISKKEDKTVTVGEMIIERRKRLEEVNKAIKKNKEELENAKQRYIEREKNESNTCIPDTVSNSFLLFDSRIYYENVLSGYTKEGIRLEKEIAELERNILN